MGHSAHDSLESLDTQSVSLLRKSSQLVVPDELRAEYLTFRRSMAKCEYRIMGISYAFTRTTLSADN